ncbi:MAG: 50S ribosomal protein L29 [Gammaproteobacteria bacterium]|nr:50S ribosomal protein L29 [Gammaproteobacteria bacterium]
MKASEMRQKSVQELQTELQALLQEQFNLRIQKGLGETPRAHNFQNVRRSIARIKTILNEKARESHAE